MNEKEIIRFVVCGGGWPQSEHRTIEEAKIIEQERLEHGMDGPIYIRKIVTIKIFDEIVK